jgi:hypothetical protein
MNKELREKLARLPITTDSILGDNRDPFFLNDGDIERILKLLDLLGYRKVKGEPPVLSLEEMQSAIWSMGMTTEANGKEINQKIRFETIAQAQRDADVRFYNDPRLLKRR